MENTRQAQVNNSIYDGLGEQWYHAYDNPVALLRAESKVKTPWMVKKIKYYTPGTCKILDIGCGAGFLSNALSSFGYSVTGIDTSQESLSVAEKHDVSGNVDYRAADAYQLPFENEVFEVVAAMDFLEHVENPERVIFEAGRVLKPGGLFFFHTFNRNWISQLVAIKGVEWFVKNTPKNLHVLRLFITPGEMAQYCRSAALRVQEVLGLKPEIKLKHVPSFLKGTVPKDFRFTLTKSLRISYLGYAIKDA